MAVPATTLAVSVPSSGPTPVASDAVITAVIADLEIAELIFFVDNQAGCERLSSVPDDGCARTASLASIGCVTVDECVASEEPKKLPVFGVFCLDRIGADRERGRRCEDRRRRACRVNCRSDRSSNDGLPILDRESDHAFAHDASGTIRDRLTMLRTAHRAGRGESEA